MIATGKQSNISAATLSEAQLKSCRIPVFTTHHHPLGALVTSFRISSDEKSGTAGSAATLTLFRRGQKRDVERKKANIVASYLHSFLSSIGSDNENCRLDRPNGRVEERVWRCFS